MNNSVTWPIAKTIEGQWVHINEAKHGENYHCPECESPFVAKLGKVRAHHFAHKSNYTGVCSGESRYHILAKNLLAYYFEKEAPQISLIFKCMTCGKSYSGLKKIIDVEVERGQDIYRPDVHLLLEDNITIDCEVVFKNPIDDKLNAYRAKQSNLLIWFIPGQVGEVPPLIQYSWQEFEEFNLTNAKKLKDHLLLMTSPPSNHTCSPYGTAYIVKVYCYKCHHQTKAALLSRWFPSLRELKLGEHSGGVEYQIYNNSNSVPSYFLSQLNKVYGIKLFQDHSDLLNKDYLMNHCSRCGEKFRDGLLLQRIKKEMNDNKNGSRYQKVEIPFTLTDEEKKRMVKSG